MVCACTYTKVLRMTGFTGLYWNSHISVSVSADLQTKTCRICRFRGESADSEANLQTLGALVFRYLRGVKMHPAEVHFCALGGVPARTIPKPARRP